MSETIQILDETGCWHAREERLQWQSSIPDLIENLAAA